MQVIPNGFDTTEFRPHSRLRERIRQALGLPGDAFVVGHVARFDRAKDHATLCETAKICCALDHRVRFVMCGEGITPANRDLAARLDGAGIAHRCLLLGRREDMPAVMSSLDLLASSSVVEGFPNVLGEAMSCAVPCVATDAGDSRIIIGNTGIVVRIGDASALAAGILQIVRMGTAERTALGQRARQRIIDDFSLARAVQSYERLYDELTEPCAA